MRWPAWSWTYQTPIDLLYMSLDMNEMTSIKLNSSMDLLYMSSDMYEMTSINWTHQTPIDLLYMSLDMYEMTSMKLNSTIDLLYMSLDMYEMTSMKLNLPIDLLYMSLDMYEMTSMKLNKEKYGICFVVMYIWNGRINIYILGAFTEKSHSKPLEHNIVYTSIITLSHAMSYDVKWHQNKSWFSAIWLDVSDIMSKGLFHCY